MACRIAWSKVPEMERVNYEIQADIEDRFGPDAWAADDESSHLVNEIGWDRFDELRRESWEAEVQRPLKSKPAEIAGSHRSCDVHTNDEGKAPLPTPARQSAGHNHRQTVLIGTATEEFRKILPLLRFRIWRVAVGSKVVRRQPPVKKPKRPNLITGGGATLSTNSG